VKNEAATVSSLLAINSDPKLPPPPSPSSRPAKASELLSRLRWANLGYSYHWGTKSYDLTKLSSPFPKAIAEICQSVVATIDWEDVWRGNDESFNWDGDMPEWPRWRDSYRQYSIIRIFAFGISNYLLVPDAGIVNFYKTGVLPPID